MTGKPRAQQLCSVSTVHRQRQRNIHISVSGVARIVMKPKLCPLSKKKTSILGLYVCLSTGGHIDEPSHCWLYFAQGL